MSSLTEHLFRIQYSINRFLSSGSINLRTNDVSNGAEYLFTTSLCCCVHFFFVCLVVQVAAVEQAIHDTDGGWNLFVLNRRQAESSEMSASG